MDEMERFEIEEAQMLAAEYGMDGQPPEKVRDLEVIETEILIYKAQAGSAILEIGRRLIEAKEQLGHGEWLPWLKEKVDFSEATAQRFMRLAKEYRNPSPVTDLGASKALALLALPEDEREDFVAEKHMVNGEEKTATEMSKRELEKVIRERDEAVKKAAAMEQEMADQLAEQQNVYDTDMADARGAVEAAEHRAEETAAKLDKQRKRTIDYASKLDAANAELMDLHNQLEEMQNQPAPEPEKVIDQEAVDEAAKKARAEAEEKLRAKIEKAEKAKTKAEQDLAAAKLAQEEASAVAEKERQSMADQLASLQKKLAMASSGEITVFKLHFEQAQASINKMAETINRMKQAGQSAEADKLVNALHALLTTTMEAVK